MIAAAGIEALAGTTPCADASNQRVAVLAWHCDVGQEHVDALAPQHVVRVSGRRGREHHTVATLQMFGNHKAAFLIVVDHEHAHVVERRRLDGRADVARATG